MSKLTDIKNRIDQMDGGAFQNLCDAYLSYKGYKNVYSLGMHTGTDKTAKGNPDTYFLTAENKYVFVMYTTQKTNFLKKAIEDIDKCFDSQKTGVSAKDIAEIIYCHTYDRLGPGDDQYLREYCEKRGAVLTLIGLDQLGNDIFRECPILAQDFFGISIDSGQILSLDMFVAKHDANKMSAPLGTEFLLREMELEKAKTALRDNDVLLIAGPAGVGKTRFALELCRQLAEENGYTALVIKNNNLQLYEDLVSAIEEGKESPYVFNLYAYWVLDHRNQQEADELLRTFSNELPLLEEIYLKGILCSTHEDFYGALLYAIISVDTSFLYRYIDCLITAQGNRFRARDTYDTKRLLKIWDAEQYMDLADGVFDYCYNRQKELAYWIYWSPVNMMLHHEASHRELVAKQDLWMQHAIEKYSYDKDRMRLLFTAIEELSCERRRKAVEKFLSLNADPDAFERLPLEPSYCGGSGSMIPYMQERIEYLRSLLPLVSGIKYLKQKQRIESEIGCWKERIHSEEVRELLESWYC